MMLFKKAVPRRTFLRGLGATVALPLLDAMVPAMTPVRLTAATPTKRFGVVYMPLGAVNEWSSDYNMWTPVSNEPGFAYRPIVKSLEPYREHITFVSNMCQGELQGDIHVPAGWLAGMSRVKRTEGEDVLAGTTIDQIIARTIGQEQPFPSLELATEDYTGFVGACVPGFACSYVNTISWSSPTTPLPRDLNPRVLFERLFGRPGTAQQRVARMKSDRSILDSLADEANSLRRGLSAKDRARMDDYLGNVREIERRIQRTEALQSTQATNIDAPIGIPDTAEEHIGLMYDLMLIAYQADLTRVITFMMGREVSMRVWPELGVMEPHHALSHHQNEPERIVQLTKVQAWFVSQFAKFVQKMQATPDGDGSLLDHSLILYGSSMGNSNQHATFNLPTLLVGHGGGTIKGDRFLDQPKNTPFGNLLLGIAQHYGASVETMGASTSTLAI